MPERFLITGGSGGIGSAVARRLAGAGYQPLVGYARNEAAAIEVAQSCGGVALPIDLCQDDTIDTAVRYIAEGETPLAGIVLAASPPPVLGPFGRIEPTDMRLQWQVNVMGPQRLLAGLIKQCLRPRRSGSVVGVLSAAMGDAHHPASAGMGAYVVAKHGLAGLLAVVGAEYPWLRVRMVRPGFTATPMLTAFDQRFLAAQAIQTADAAAANIVAHILEEVRA
jgi:3-oxoacyl-[acyl-carrier protein] reductase